MHTLREDRRSLAAQLRDRLWDEVQGGTLRTGERLPSEQELAGRFGVSRATVREALKTLEEERLLICRHGVGRFLAPDPSSVLSEEITHLKSVTEMAQGLGITTTTRVLSMGEEPAGDLVRSHLELGPESTVVVLERARLAHGQPIIYSIDIFPRRLVVGELRPVEFAASLISVMEAKWGMRLAYSKATISAVMLDRDLSRRIGVDEEIPWILMEQVNYDPQDRPILYSKDYHRGDKIQFRVLRRRR
jgi:GntR family transcriptional regulator